MKNEEDKRNWLVIKRWLDIFLLSIVATLIYLLCKSKIDSISNPFPEFSPSKGIIVYTLYSLLLLAFAWLILWRMGVTHFGCNNKKCIKTFVYWPPIWVSIIVSLFCIIYFKQHSPPRFVTEVIIILILTFSFLPIPWFKDFLPLILYIFGLPVGWISFCFNKRFKEKKSKNILSGNLNKKTKEVDTTYKNQDSNNNNEVYNNIKTLSQNQERFIEWLQKEEPIIEPKDDIFDMSFISRAIYRSITTTPLKTIALVGKYGSGKSSILNIVQGYLKNDDRNQSVQNNAYLSGSAIIDKSDIITCKVDGWGFTKGTAAEHILECAINELCKYADVCSLRFMPEQYTAAMGSSGNVIIQTLSSLATSCKSPLDILKKMDIVLKAIGKRFIIFLEDVDRNKTDETFFNEIASLLDNLRQLKQISFVLAIGLEYESGAILVKTCEHIENVIRPSISDNVEALENFRLFCFKLYKDKVSFLLDKIPHHRLGWEKSPNGETHLPLYAQINRPIDDISLLLDNPRVLKHALRRTFMLWEKLAGEINFDDLLIVNVLKTLDEQIFSFIDKNYGRIQELKSITEKEELEKSNEELNKELEAAIRNNKYNIDAIKRLLQTLLPALFSVNIYESWPSESSLSYQNIANDEFQRYWGRIKRGELNNDDIPDCEILSALKKLNTDDEIDISEYNNILNALSKDRRVLERVRYFKEFLSHDCLKTVASKQIDITLNKYHNKANRKVCPVIDQWFVLGPEKLDEKWKEWLSSEIIKALPISLRYATELYHFWFDPDRNRDEQFRAAIVDKAKAIFEEKPERLVNAIDPDFIYTVFDFTIYFMEKDKDTGSFLLHQWQWLGKVLLKAAKQYSKEISPQIAAMICSYHPYNREKGIEFHEKFYERDIDQIFVNKKEEVMRLLLLQGVDIGKYEEQSQKLLKLAQDEAINYFNRRNDPSQKDNNPNNVE